ncbi:GmrSD restriction endonuclease domain-containing protein [Turicimonas muris]|uniref:GmrSD restriction endonuclease domain-containing protein n=1 Tax=Turicimonas muris TaxID=1796652 RepID=UPI002494AE83|nr:DUF262 domain-containing protein [Turicimonas muris]
MDLEQKYSVNHYLVSALLNYVESKEIAIPEIQRPFVWNATKVRDLIDSLYQGYPVGYIVTWQNPDVKLKDGTTSSGKKIVIDGQQRVTALTAAILGHTVKNMDYEDIRIKIAFNPKERRFEVSNPAIEKDTTWIADIAPFLSGEQKQSALRKNYCALNPDMDDDEFDEILEGLKDIKKKEVGVIQLSGNLDIDAVTEIFIRINSQGVPLGQADFVMSKIAANESYGGNLLRKCIDHFSHLAAKPEFYGKLKENDSEFVNSEYFPAVSWLRNENEDIYDPTYVDILRVAFTYKFSRGRMSDLVSLLSGRNFETRGFEQSIEENTYKELKSGVLDFINETNFKRFIMIVRSAGFCHKKLIRSQNVLNFGYLLYLKLRALKYSPDKIEKFVKRWIVMAFLTGRYSSSPESQFDYDIKQVDLRPFEDFLKDVENARLSDAFWDAELLQRLDTSVSSSTVFNVFLASQCKMNVRGFLSTDITVKDLIEQRGDVHHIFPKEYLKKNNLSRGQYNQVANYAYVQSEINIKIGKKPPVEYLGYVAGTQCKEGENKYGGISDTRQLLANLKENCIPPATSSMSIEDYPKFLTERRKLIAQRLREYYFSL